MADRRADGHGPLGVRIDAVEHAGVGREGVSGIGVEDLRDVLARHAEAQAVVRRVRVRDGVRRVGRVERADGVRRVAAAPLDVADAEEVDRERERVPVARGLDALAALGAAERLDEDEVLVAHALEQRRVRSAELRAVQPRQAGRVVIGGEGVVGDRGEGVRHGARARARAELEERRARRAALRARRRGGSEERQDERRRRRCLPHRPLPLMIAILKNLRRPPWTTSPM